MDNIKYFDMLLDGLGFLQCANGKVTIASDKYDSELLRRFGEVGLADCYFAPNHFEATLIRRRPISFDFGFHINRTTAFSTKSNRLLTALEEYASNFKNKFHKIDREDLQHFQALSKRLDNADLVNYLSEESKPEGRHRHLPVFAKNRRSLINAVAKLAGGTPPDLFKRAKNSISIFKGDFSESMPPYGLAGDLALLDAADRGVKVEIIFGPGITLDSYYKVNNLKWYFDKNYTLSDGKNIVLKRTRGTPKRENGTAYINPKKVPESADLLYRLANLADGVDPLLADPAILMLNRAIDKEPRFDYVIALTDTLMFRGRYNDAVNVLDIAYKETTEMPDTLKSKVLAHLAASQMRSGDINNARKNINIAKDVNPEYHLPWFVSGAIEQISLKYDAAKSDLEHSLELEPDVRIVEQFLDRTERAEQLL